MNHDVRDVILFIMFYIMTIAICSIAFAEGQQVTIGDIKQVSCVPATTREDGTPLTMAEIDHHEIYITQDQVDKGQAYITGLDCMMELDTTGMVAGQWFIIGVTVDSGARKSVDSPATPFELILALARPLPPVMVLQ